MKLKCTRKYAIDMAQYVSDHSNYHPLARLDIDGIVDGWIKGGFIEIEKTAEEEFDIAVSRLSGYHRDMMSSFIERAYAAIKYWKDKSGEKE